MMLNKRICWALWAFAFANLAGIQAAPEGYPLAYAVKAGERWFLRSSFLLSIPEPGPGQKRQGEGVRWPPTRSGLVIQTEQDLRWKLLPGEAEAKEMHRVMWAVLEPPEVWETPGLRGSPNCRKSQASDLSRVLKGQAGFCPGQWEELQRRSEQAKASSGAEALP